jgi:serine phosphatase RsbU (regulator of sigma subunit)
VGPVRPLLVEDARETEPFRSMAATLDLDIGSYIGVPIQLANGDVYGTLCAIDPATRTFTADELALLQILARLLAFQIERDGLLQREQELSRQLDASVALLRQDLRDAAAIQKAALPKNQGQAHGCAVAATCIPSREVGGDFFDWFPVNGGMAVAVGDVMGKGLPAATMMMSLASAFRAGATTLGDAPAAVLSALNASLYGLFERSGMFATLATAWLGSDGTLRYADAGHGQALIWRADGTVEFPGERGLPLGISMDGGYREGLAHLGPGDALIIASDGITESVGAGEHGHPLVRVLREHVEDRGSAAAIRDQAIAGVQALAGSLAGDDDVTLLVLRRG